jgi:hypothetical protein
MKLQDLFEMPLFIDKEFPTLKNSRMLSANTIEDDYDVLWTGKRNEASISVIMKKNKSVAFIGHLVERTDKVICLQLDGGLEFKDRKDFSWMHDIKVEARNALQIDGIQLEESFQKQGLASLLYLEIVRYGYVLISDTTQYRGGRKLWESLAKRQEDQGVKIYVVDNGKVILDDANEPLEYDGSNIPADQIWSTSTNIEDSKKHVLLVLKSL